jgi:hypothetical protein
MQVAPQTQRMFELMQAYRNISFTINNLDETRFDYALDRVYWEQELLVLDAQIEWDSSAYYAAEAIAHQNEEYYPIYHARVIREAADKAQWQLDREVDDAAAAKAQLTATYVATITALHERASAATAAALELEAHAQRVEVHTKLMARYKNNGLAYLLTARQVEDPTNKLSAAKLALFNFEQYKAMFSPRNEKEVRILICSAQEVADAAQKELDKPFYVNWFEYARELLVTG